MIIHSPVISGSLTFADGATFTLPDNGIYSGSFSGSFQGDGSSLTFGGTNIISSSDQLAADFLDTLGDGVISGSDQLTASLDLRYLEINGDGVVSGSSQISYNGITDKPTLISGSTQVEFNNITDNPFTQGVGSVSVDRAIVPTNLNIDLGSVSAPFRDLYLSSASLYVDGTQVISSNTNELIITTDANQSLKLVETGADTIQLQSENGDITITTTGTGNIELDAPIQIGAGNQILSSDGNAIQFGEDINVQGNITLTGTVDGIDLQSFSGSVDSRLDTLEDNVTAQPLTYLRINGDSVVSGSSQIDITQTTNYTSFSSSLATTDSGLDSRITTLEGESHENPLTFTDSSTIDFTRTGDSITADVIGGIVSSSAQVDHNQTTNYDSNEHFTQAQITTVGTVTAGSVTAILPSGTISGSAQVSIPLSQVNDVTATAAEVNVLDGITASTVELNYVDGVTSNIQTQLDSKQSAGSYVTTTSAQALSSNTDALTFAANILTLTRGDGSTDTVNLSAYLDDTNLARIISGTYNTGSQELVFTRDDATTFSIDASYFFDDTNLVTSVNGRTGGVVTTLSDYGVTATSTELNYVDGVTSNIQTQLNGKLDTTHDFTITLTGDVSGTGTVTNMGNVSFSTTVANDSHSHSNYITSNASDTASGVYTFSNTTSSTSKTSGAIVVSGGIGIGGDVFAGGDVVAYASSDERLKKNIELISNPIQKVKQLKGVTWNWKDEASEAQKATPALGVIAQDVEKVLPQLVDTRDNGYKAVDYGKMVGLLIEAIKDQQKQIDDLKSRLQ